MTYNKMFGIGKEVSALELINLSREFLEAFSNVEMLCPPDDSDSWPENAMDYIQDRNELEDKLKDLLMEVNKHGVQIDF